MWPTHERVQITKNGRDYVVLMAADDLESIEATLELLSDPEAQRRLVRSEEDVVDGDVLDETAIRSLLADRLRRTPERAFGSPWPEPLPVNLASTSPKLSLALVWSSFSEHLPRTRVELVLPSESPSTVSGGLAGGSTGFATASTSKLRLSTSLTSISGGMPIEPERVKSARRRRVTARS